MFRQTGRQTDDRERETDAETDSFEAAVFDSYLIN